MNNLQFDQAKLQDILNNLEKNIEDLKSTYNEIAKEMTVIDGTNDIWKSDTQKTVHEYYKEVEKDFEESVQNLNNCKEFLKATIDNYSNSIASNQKNAEDSGDSLEINN